MPAWKSVNADWLATHGPNLKAFLINKAQAIGREHETNYLRFQWPRDELQLLDIEQDTQLPGYGDLRSLCSKLVYIYTRRPDWNIGIEDGSPEIFYKTFFQDVMSECEAHPSRQFFPDNIGLIGLEDWDIDRISQSHRWLWRQVRKEMIEELHMDDDSHYDTKPMIPPVCQVFFIIAMPYYTEKAKREHSVLLVRTKDHRTKLACGPVDFPAGCEHVGSNAVRTTIFSALVFNMDVDDRERVANAEYRAFCAQRTARRQQGYEKWAEEIMEEVEQGYVSSRNQKSACMYLYVAACRQRDPVGFQAPSYLELKR